MITRGGAGGASTTPTTPTAAAVQLLVSSQQMLSSATATTVLTAVVLDGSGQALSGRAVTFSKGADSSAYFSGVTAITGTNGLATATLNIGTNMANRAIAVSATADTAVGTNTVNVAGTKIAISGNTSLALNASSTLTIIVKDSAGAPVPGVTLTVASQNGNPVALSPASGITDSTGQITALVTANNSGAGTDTLTVSGAGVTQNQTITINSANFAFTAPVIVAPASTPDILVNTATPVSVRWFNGGSPVPDGTAITFNTSRGSFTPSTATTVSGIATSSISAASTGATILTASGAGGTPAATLNVVFVTASASSIAVQASPSTVAVNTAGSTAKQSVISVVVRDTNNSLVKNAHVIFSLTADASGGSLAANTATTDITGTASVNYIAGTSTSGQNGVRIDATVDMVNSVAIPNITSNVLLTVASQALFVRLATDNKIFPDVPVQGTYTKKYTALVTDAAGNPPPDGTTQVRFVLRPAAVPADSFYKGYFEYKTAVPATATTPAISAGWKQKVVEVCVSEDANQDGQLQVGEDTNGNGRLDPTGSASVNSTASTISGFAVAEIRYAKDFAYWVVNELEARAGTAGNDPPSVVTLELPGLASDYTDPLIAPPGERSPFGIAVGCDNTN